MSYDKKKYLATIIAKYGSIEAYKKAQAEHGKIGGQLSTGRTFRNVEKARAAGRKGGSISKRRKVNEQADRGK